MNRSLDVLHLTVLNPARHTRIFHKLAWSQARAGLQVAVAGQDPAASPFEQDGIQLYPIRPFRRLSWRRWTVRRSLYRLASRLRPAWVVIHTPELLPLARRLHRRYGIQVWYDVHEDYATNLQEAAHYPVWLREILARRVRQMELAAVPWLTRVSYAEACYWDLLRADGRTDALVLPNLFPAHLAQTPDCSVVPSVPYYLYCGTIAEAWGVFTAIDWWEQLQPADGLPLVIAGHCAEPGFWQRLQARIARSPHRQAIRIIGGQEYVPYPQIVALIQGCRAGFGLYAPLPHLIHKVPTKFYEFLALGKPLLYPRTGYWAQFGDQHPLGVGISAETTVEEVWERLSQWCEARDKAPYIWEELTGRLNQW